MGYCKYCGNQVRRDEARCPYCGSSLQEYVERSYDSGSAGWAVLGFFFPIVGLILYLVWKNERPESARKAGIGALVSVIFSVIVWICTMVIFVRGSGLM